MIRTFLKKVFQKRLEQSGRKSWKLERKTRRTKLSHVQHVQQRRNEQQQSDFVLFEEVTHTYRTSSGLMHQIKCKKMYIYFVDNHNSMGQPVSKSDIKHFSDQNQLITLYLINKLNTN